MKSKRIQPLLGTLGLISVVFTASQLHAAPLYKVNNSDNLNLTSSWTTISGLINPPGSLGASDALYFNEVNMQGDKTLALGGNLAVGGIAVDYVTTDSSNNVTISAGNTLTLNGTTLFGNGQDGSGGSYATAGIVLNRGTGGVLTIGSDIALGAAQQWVSGRTGTNGFTVNGNLALGANNLSLNVAGGVSTISGAIGGSGKVTKIGGGTLLLPNANSFTGGFQLGPDGGAANTGVVTIGNAGSLGTAGIISRGTQLRSSVAALNLANNITVGAGGFRVGGSNNFTLSGTTTIDNNSRSIANYGSATVTLGAITLGGTASRAAFDVGGNIVVNGNITGTGSTTPGTGAVIVTAGRVAFNGANTYTGQTNVTGGTITGTGNFPTLLAMSGGAIAIPGGATTNSALTFGAGATFTNTPTLTFDAAPVAATVYDVFNYTGTLTGLANLKSAVRGSFADAGTKVTFTPGAANQTRTWNPTLATGNWDGTGTAANWLEGDNLFYNGDAAVFNEPNAPTTVTLTGTPSATGFAVNNTTNGYTFAGALTGGTGLVKTGSGTATFTSGSHSYTGNVVIDGGTVNANAGTAASVNTALGLSSGSRTVTVNNGGTLAMGTNNVLGHNAQTLGNTIRLIINAGGTVTSNNFNTLGNIDLNGGTLTATAGPSFGYQAYEFLGSTLTVGGSAPSLVSSTAASNGGMHIAGNTTLTLDVADVTSSASTDLTISAALRNGSNDRAGNGSLLKTGAGTAVLSNSNVYSGSTTVNAGTLTIVGGLAGNAAINVASGATFGTSGTLGTIGTGGVSAATITNDGTVRIGSSAAQSLTGTLTGSGSLVKAGTGTLTLDSLSVIEHTGATTVSAGTLVVDSSIENSLVTVSGTGNLTGQGYVATDVTINGGAITGDNEFFPFEVGSLTFDSTGTVNIGDLADYEFSPAIESVGDLTTNGGAASVTVNLPTAPVAAGTYQLIASANTLANTTAFALGTMPALGARQSGTLVANPGSLDYVVAGVNPSWTGEHSGEWSTATLPSPKNWFTNVETDYIDGDAVTFDDSANGTTTVTLNATVSPASVLFDHDSLAYSVTGTGSIAGTGTLTKSGIGTLTLATANTYSGGTVVNGGILDLSSGASLGAGAIALNNAQLTLAGHTLANDIATTNGTIGGTTATLNGVISGSGLNIATTGIVTLTGVNTYTGDTLVTSGGLEITGAGQLNSGTYNGNITNPALLRFDTTADQSLGGSITGNGQLVKNNTNTLALTGTPGYTGTTTINGGTLVLGSPNFVKVASPTLNVNSGATLRIDSTNILYAGGDFCTVAVDGGTVALNANHNHFGPLALSNGAVINGIRPTDSYNNEYSTFDREVTVGGTATSTISGNLTNVGYNVANSANGGFTVNPTGDASGADLLVSGSFRSGALVKNGDGVMRLTGSNLYGGNTTINGGVLELSATGKLYNGGYNNTAVLTINTGGTW
ncbi:MAG: autotransporter-associated beta strand repeat-containing protein, partial [Verrucomicrobiae bacterium]|nr:autotransporter-associated beta strand repeat-containing protein [Verrucomicrobiae bacterium]